MISAKGQRTGVSQRHLSCVETVRSRAGRETLMALLDELRPTLQPRRDVETGNLPVLAFRLRAADGRILGFFSTIASFGTPLDITWPR